MRLEKELTGEVRQSAQDPIIQVSDVTFTYLGEREPAIRDIDLTINKGDFALVLGPSSAGKSTLVSLFNGSIPSVFEGDLQGEVVVDGRNTADVPISELATVVGMVFQDPEAQLINVLVKDEIYFGPENLLMPTDEIVRNAKEAMQLVEIEDLIDEGIFQLSGGQKQKVALASVLAMNPQVITLDQPTANLDPKTKLEVFKVLGRLNQELGMTIIVIEHDVDDLADLVNKVIVMEEGRILTVGEPRQVFSKSFQSFSEELGLWIPQISELALKTENLISFPEFPLTVSEAEAPVEVALRDRPLGPYETHSERQATPDSDVVPLIEVKDLDFTYKANGKEALSNVNLVVNPHEFLAIVGKNGSGKSTLAKVLMKINRVENGKVFIKGKDINDISVFELTDTIGYVFQSPDHQFIADTVYEEVAYSLRVRGIEEKVIEDRVHEVLELFHLENTLEVSPFSLSMGQRRLLSVATMLVLDQDVIILDEPTIGQDQASSNLLMGFLDKLNREGKAIIIISHDMRLISRWVSRAFVMSESHVLFDGGIEKVFDQPQLLENASLLPPPLVVLMQRLRKKGLDLPSSVLTVEQFGSVFFSKAI